MAIDAVLFDWGDTLFHFEWDESFLEAGWEAGLAALGRDDVPGHEETAARFRERYLPLLWVPGSLDEIEYPGMVRELLAGFGLELSDEELRRFLAAEHAAWEPARLVGAQSHALLDSLRDRGLRLPAAHDLQAPRRVRPARVRRGQGERDRPRAELGPPRLHA